eukprot:TRINITY_DN7599_c0_g2_i1.p1 TRINITY_DN7599_c0_g2~~TRINITY_DN7599_c0_g2_i1.p1  ORF type:complete len:418 (-),score=24.41 TRINITY_DN7599_c0_g2_i1:56-1270(-)
MGLASAFREDGVNSLPFYTAWTADESDCLLLCEADVRCADWQFTYKERLHGKSDTGSANCVVSCHADAEGSPTPEGANHAACGRQSQPASAKTRGSRPHVLLATYASGEKFERTQRLLDASLTVAEIDDHQIWNRSVFEGTGEHADWFRRHQKTNFRRGGAWKPFVIWQAFRSLKWGEWLVYHDSSQYFPEGFSSSVRPLMAWLERHQASNPCRCLAATRLRQTLQHEWEQRCIPEYGLVRDRENAFEIFCGLMWRLGACTPSAGADCCRRIYNRPTLQHAWSIWHKNPRSARFLREWATQSTDFESIAHLPFIDQSLNTLLVHTWHERLQLRTLWSPRLYYQSWEQGLDTDAMGRVNGDPFKHMNPVLDMLYNEAVLKEQLLWLADLAVETPGSAGFAFASDC